MRFFHVTGHDWSQTNTSLITLPVPVNTLRHTPFFELCRPGGLAAGDERLLHEASAPQRGQASPKYILLCRLVGATLRIHWQRATVVVLKTMATAQGWREAQAEDQDFAEAAQGWT